MRFLWRLVRSWGERRVNIRHAALLAEQRARVLLRECLTPSQWSDYSTFGFFHVRGGSTGRTYRIAHGTVMNVEPLNADGTVAARLCFAPSGNLPTCDVLLAQKLALEAMEDSVLDIANFEGRQRSLAEIEGQRRGYCGTLPRWRRS